MTSSGQAQQSKVVFTAASVVLTGLVLYICTRKIGPSVPSVPSVATESSELEEEQALEVEQEREQALDSIELPPVPVLDSITTRPDIVVADVVDPPVEMVVQIVETEEATPRTNAVHASAEQNDVKKSELSAPALPNVAETIDRMVVCSDDTVVDDSSYRNNVVTSEVLRKPTKLELTSSDKDLDTTVSSTSEDATTPVVQKHKSRRSFMNKLRIRRKNATKTTNKSQDTLATNKTVSQ
jgi:hypothetical protein